MIHFHDKYFSRALGDLLAWDTVANNEKGGGFLERWAQQKRRESLKKHSRGGQKGQMLEGECLSGCHTGKTDGRLFGKTNHFIHKTRDVPSQQSAAELILDCQLWLLEMMTCKSLTWHYSEYLCCRRNRWLEWATSCPQDSPEQTAHSFCVWT